MDSKYDDVISAALDGERVDVGALRRALAAPEGRDTLAAFVLLRAATADDDIKPVRRCEDFAVIARRRRPAWLLAGPRVPAAWAASIAIVAVGLAFWFGTTLRAPNTTLAITVPPTVLATPAQAPVVVPAPAPVATEHRRTDRFGVVDGRAGGRVPDQPPTPTRVLRFVPGVDWISAPE
jgi:hypothetical protein